MEYNDNYHVIHEKHLVKAIVRSLSKMIKTNHSFNYVQSQNIVAMLSAKLMNDRVMCRDIKVHTDHNPSNNSVKTKVVISTNQMTHKLEL